MNVAGGISVVIPVFQNGETLRETFDGVRAALTRLTPGPDWEAIFVDDGSTDGSWEVLRELRREDPGHVVAIRFLRNFGQVSAIVAGFRYARGACVVVLSADLQDPTALIGDMVAAWRRGAKVVIAARETREDGWLRALTSRAFYGLMKRYAISSLPAGGFDFFLLDREAYEVLAASPEQHRFLQGEVLWFGYEPCVIPYRRRARVTGRSQWSLWHLVKYFIDGFVAFSFAPIRLAAALGILAFLCGVLLSLGLIVQRVWQGTMAPGWTSLMIAMLLLNGMQMIVLGVFGEYLWRHLELSRQRPLFIVREVLRDDRGQEAEEVRSESARVGDLPASRRN